MDETEIMFNHRIKILIYINIIVKCVLAVCLIFNALQLNFIFLIEKQIINTIMNIITNTMILVTKEGIGNT